MYMQVAELLRPAADALRLAALEHLASNLEAVVMADMDGMAWLPLSCLLDLLAHAALVRRFPMLSVLSHPQTGILAVAAVLIALCEGQQHCCLQDCREFLLWESVVRWAANGSRSSGSASGGLQRELAEVEQALPLIRFPLMSEAELDAIAVHPLARSSRLLCELLAEARAAHADAARAQELQVRPQPHHVYFGAAAQQGARCNRL